MDSVTFSEGKYSQNTIQKNFDLHFIISANIVNCMEIERVLQNDYALSTFHNIE